jgi:prepilin-type N-terminal cleavage/methylation domain-containing protein
MIRDDRGTTLPETLIALAVLGIAIAGLLGLVTTTAKLTEDEGHLSARATEYAQDKMEQLLALAYGDTTSNTAVYPATPGGGTGLAIGGSANPAAPAAGYVDWLDVNGNLLVSNGVTPPAGWFYKRVWQTENPGANIKRVSVTTIVAFNLSRNRLQQATLVSLKTNFPQVF